MKKVTLVSGEPGAGHAIELSLGLREYVDLTTVWRVRSAYKFDYLEPHALYGYGNIPPEGDEIIIVSTAGFNLLRKYYRNHPGGLDGFLSGYNEVKIVITDDSPMFDPQGYIALFKNYQVWATICKIHFRGDEPTKPYYRPFDLSNIDRTKNEKLTVAHSPFCAKKRPEKGTAEIEEIVKGRNVDFDIISGLTWADAIQRKAKAHIFVDQIDHFRKGEFKYFNPDYTWIAFGKSSDEAMHLGCLTITWGRDQDIGHPIPPVAWCTKENFEGVLDYYISEKSAREELANKQYEWQMQYGTRDYAAKNLLNLL